MHESSDAWSAGIDVRCKNTSEVGVNEGSTNGSSGLGRVGEGVTNGAPGYLLYKKYGSLMIPVGFKEGV